MDSPCWLISKPIASSSSETLKGDIRSVIFNSISEPPNANAETINNAFMCTINSAVSPKNKPFPVVFAPLIGIDVTTTNQLNLKFEYKGQPCATNFTCQMARNDHLWASSLLILLKEVSVMPK